MKPYLETKRLVLRELTIEHLDGLVEMDRDPEVMKHIDDRPPVPGQACVQKLRQWLNGLSVMEPSLNYWAAHLQAGGDFIGRFHLRRNPHFDFQVELGCRLQRACWGSGYATEGSRALLAKGFHVLGLDYIMATTLERHAASRRVLEKVGMALETHFVYPPELLPFWPEEEKRKAVKYSMRNLF